MSEKKSVIQMARGRGLDPKVMLMDATKEAWNYEEVVIITRNKEGPPTVWATTAEPWFLATCGLIMNDYALKSLNGEIVDE